MLEHLKEAKPTLKQMKAVLSTFCRTLRQSALVKDGEILMHTENNIEPQETRLFRGRSGIDGISCLLTLRFIRNSFDVFVESNVILSILYLFKYCYRSFKSIKKPKLK